MVIENRYQEKDGQELRGMFEKEYQNRTLESPGRMLHRSDGAILPGLLCFYIIAYSLRSSGCAFCRVSAAGLAAGTAAAEAAFFVCLLDTRMKMMITIIKSGSQIGMVVTKKIRNATKKSFRP